MMSVFDDDPELLRTALAIIEGWEVDADATAVDADLDVAVEREGGASSPPDTPESDSRDGSDDGAAGVKKKELKASTLASTRVRRREEILYLRGIVKELEEQLEQLQTVEKKPVDATSLSHVITGMWRDIAGRQQRLRQRLELEQAKLKDQLAVQMKVARGLVKLMEKAKRLEKHEDFLRPKRSRIGMEIGSTQSMDDRLTHMQMLYEQRHMAFMHDRFMDLSLKFIDITTREAFDDHMVLEVCGAWAVPFTWQRVLDAVWAFQIKRSEGNVYQPYYDATVTLEDDLLISTFRGSVSTPSLTRKCNGVMLAKRFLSADAAAAGIVSHTTTNLDTDEPWSENRLTLGDFWLRTVPLPIEAHGSTVSLVQYRERFRIYYGDKNSPTSKRQAGLTSNLILDYIKLEVDLRHQVVETLLLSSHH